jgi:hypothetical protein
MTDRARRLTCVSAVGAAMLAALLLVVAGASGHGQRTFKNRVFASGAKIFHRAPKGREAISNPDDITFLDGHIFVGFQNGVGPQGQASPTGNKNSTVVEFNLRGRAVDQWDIVGKCDGLTADRLTGQLIATVNEDANSSVYLIDPASGRSGHYRYNRPLPHKGGTDAIEIYRGMVLISASAPGTTGKPAPQPNYPAVYRVVFNRRTRVATVRPLFYDESAARVANTNSPDRGKTVRLALTDPDSNEVVPAFAARFGGQFMLTSQGDEEQIFVNQAGRARQSLSVLKLAASVDDTTWPTGPRGAIYTTDNGNNTINKITGPFVRGGEYAAVTPCDQNDAPSTCPGPGFPHNYLGRINPSNGGIGAIIMQGPEVDPQGMLFLP